MANIYTSSASYAAVPAWGIGLSRSSTSNGGRGDYTRQAATPAVGSERVFRCTTGGMTGATEPAWTLTKNGTTTDSGVVWTECTGEEAGGWLTPHARGANAFAATWSTAGDTFFVGDNHAETAAAVIAWNPPGTTAAPFSAVCVLVAGSVPPVAADIRATATVTSTGANGITIGNLSTVGRIEGVAFSAGSGATSAVLGVGSGNVATTLAFKNCKLIKAGTTASGNAIQIGSSGAGTARLRCTLENTQLGFGIVGDSVSLQITDFYWYSTASALTGAIVPTTLFSATALTGKAWLEGIGLSAFGSGKRLVASQTGGRDFYFKDCFIDSAVVVALQPVDQVAGAIYVLRSDSAAAGYRSEKHMHVGTQVMETVIVRTGGASDGVTPVSWNITTVANAKWMLPFETLPLAVFNPTVAANVTATVEGIWNAAALPNNEDIWTDLEYLGSATSPLGSLVSSSKATILSTPAAHAASTQAWDSLVTARANSTAYVVGNVRKVASNAGRIFFATVAGTSAASEPTGAGGFSSAVDGGTVTDGGVTWRAGVRFKLVVTASSPQPQLAGNVYVYPKAGKASSTFYLDPKTVLS